MNDSEIIALCEQECNKVNLPFNEDWVNINRLYGYATVIDDVGRVIIARIDIWNIRGLHIKPQLTPKDEDNGEILTL